MEISTRELSLTDLEDELVRVKQAKKITEEFLDSVASIPQEKITELQNLKENLELLKNFDKKESKESFIVKLSEREINLGKAIVHMKESGEKVYNPKNVVF